MKQTIQFKITKWDKYFVGECVDLPIVTQASTLDEMYKNIQEAVELHMEWEDSSVFDLVKNPAIIANLEVVNLHHA